MEDTLSNTKGNSGYKEPDVFETAKEDMKRRNEYDYNKMIEDFNLRETVAKGLKQKLKGVVKLNKKYPSIVETMKNIKIQLDEDKRKKAQEEIEEKERRHEAQLMHVRGENNEKLLIAMKERENKATNVRKRHQKVLDLQEKERIDEGKRTEERLRSFTEANHERRLDWYYLYDEKMKKSLDLHKKNIDLRDREYEQFTKERQEKAMEKYTKNYWSQKERLSTKKNDKKTKSERRMQLMKELQEENEKERLNKAEKYMQKINMSTQKSIEIEDKRRRDLEKVIMEQQMKFRETKKKIREVEEEDEEFRKDILEYQKMLIFKGSDKVETHMKKKTNARDNVILSQMEKERKLALFNKDLDKLKDESIMKKSIEQRRKIYNQLMREEAEKKKKEEEDKKLGGS